jgi:Protein of unknown function (DUF2569)
MNELIRPLRPPLVIQRNPELPYRPILAKYGRHMKQRKRDLVGIGGWLILLAIGQVVTPLLYLASLFAYYSGPDSGFYANFPIAFYPEAVLFASTLALISYTTYLFFKKSSLFPAFLIFEYAALILVYPVDVIFVAAVLSAYTGEPVETFTARMSDPKEVAQWIATIVKAAIWTTYIKRSKRVANTFINR